MDPIFMDGEEVIFTMDEERVLLSSSQEQLDTEEDEDTPGSQDSITNDGPRFPRELMKDTEMLELFAALVHCPHSRTSLVPGSNRKMFYAILEKHRDAYVRLLPQLTMKFFTSVGTADLWLAAESAHFDVVCHSMVKMPPVSISAAVPFLRDFMLQGHVSELALYKIRQYFVWFYQHN